MKSRSLLAEEIYKLGISLSDKIDTLVHHNFEADAFPSNLEEWEIINSNFSQKDENIF
jgi:hypothetical protein